MLSDEDKEWIEAKLNSLLGRLEGNIDQKYEALICKLNDGREVASDELDRRMKKEAEDRAASGFRFDD